MIEGRHHKKTNTPPVIETREKYHLLIQSKLIYPFKLFERQISAVVYFSYITKSC